MEVVLSTTLWSSLICYSLLTNDCNREDAEKIWEKGIRAKRVERTKSSSLDGQKMPGVLIVVIDWKRWEPSVGFLESIRPGQLWRDFPLDILCSSPVGRTRISEGFSGNARTCPELQNGRGPWSLPSLWGTVSGPHQLPSCNPSPPVQRRGCTTFRPGPDIARTRSFRL